MAHVAIAEHLDKGDEQDEAADRPDDAEAEGPPRFDQIIGAPAPRDPHARHRETEHADPYQHPYLPAEPAGPGDQHGLDQRQRAEREHQQPAAPADPLPVVEPQPRKQPEQRRHHHRQGIAQNIGKARRLIGIQDARQQIGDDRDVHRDRDPRRQDGPMVAHQNCDPQREQCNRAAANHRVDYVQRRHRRLLAHGARRRHRA